MKTVISKKRLAIILIFGLLIVFGYYSKRRYYDPRHRAEIAKAEVKALETNTILKNGDIIFQTPISRQSKAIQIATKSKYSHCGIIFWLDTASKWYVLEAVQPVKWTLLEKWISRDEGGHYVIKRNDTDPPIPDEMLLKLNSIGDKYLGKPYDFAFCWTDDKIYCSELVWKCYKELTGLDFGNLQQLSDFDLSDKIVKQKLKERYGDKIPLNEMVISPVAIFNSNLLKTIKEN
jgi:hypothetical protein